MGFIHSQQQLECLNSIGAFFGGLLKGHARRKNEIVVGSVEVRGGKLHARPQRQRDSIVDRKPAHYQPWSEKYLLVAVLHAAMKKR